MNNSVYQVITDQIIAKLEAGEIPWRQPWKNYGPDGGPRNGYTKRPYRGINLFLLAGTYGSPDYFSIHQINALGGRIRKGEHGQIVTFWKVLQYIDPTGEHDDDGEPEVKRIPMLRYYTVFNRKQCDGLPPVPEAEPVPDAPINPIETAETIVTGYTDGPAIREGEDSAYYRPSLDIINMPKRASFACPEEWYSVLFHEMTHSTGHASRLGRLEKCRYYLDDDRSREELCAEMGAAFLCGRAGIERATLDNSAAYIQSWLRVFKGDPRFVVDAAGAAQKAVDWILNNRHQEEPTESGDATAQPVRKPRKSSRNRSADRPQPQPAPAEQMEFSF